MTDTHKGSFVLVPQESFQWMRHAVCTLVHERRIASRGVPPAWLSLYRDFMSDNGHRFHELKLDAEQSDTGDDLICSSEAAVHIGCSERHVTRLANAGELYGIRRGRNWWFSQDQVVAYIERKDRSA